MIPTSRALFVMNVLKLSTLQVLGCWHCPSDLPLCQGDEGSVRCTLCSVNWPIGPHGAVNALGDAADSVYREIDGMRAEHPSRYPSRESFFFQEVDRVSRLEDRIADAEREGGAKNYYRSTELNFRYVFEKLAVTGAERVLEVGAEHDFPFLRPFRERGCECYATNLFYCYERDRRPEVQVVLGDMNHLPFRSGVFDVVLLSATSHHSPDLRGLLAELARVTKPNGWILLLNDPTHGILKHALDRFGWGSPKGGVRHDLVNENEYSVAAYRHLAKAAGLVVHESFFSVYYDEKLRTGQVTGVRFSLLAKAVSWLWRLKPIRWLLLKTALCPGQMLIGLELNLALKKRPR